MATPKQRAAKNALAAHAWIRLFQLFISTRGRRDDTLERFGLTPNDARALHTLDADDGKPMRALADAWGTDASNATWVVDRLERLGLAERRAVPSDRRVKLVLLTARGIKTREAIMQAFYEPPAELLALDIRELATLDSILAKVAPSPAAPSTEALGAQVARRRAGRRPGVTSGRTRSEQS